MDNTSSSVEKNVIVENLKGKYIIAGAETMLGRYLQKELKSRKALDRLTVFNCTALPVESLGLFPLRSEWGDENVGAIVHVSSYEVYSPDAGEDVDETRPVFAWSEAGRVAARTELAMEKWCRANGITLTIVRPAMMFGTGVDGELLRLFNRVIRGHYVHIRDNDARMSAVTALDAARATVMLAGRPGIYNISDGRSHTWLALVEAMTANAGAQKRMTHLPEKWAKFIYKWFGSVPIVEETLSPHALEPFSRTLVLDNSRVAEATGILFHDTLEVIARRDKTYPYENA